MSVAQQRALVAQLTPGISVQARCQALGLVRSSFYYQPCGESAENLRLMRLLDEEFTFLGLTQLRRLQAPAGRHIGNKALFINNKAPAGRHLLLILASVALPGTTPLGLNHLLPANYYRYVALPGTTPLGLAGYGFA